MYIHMYICETTRTNSILKCYKKSYTFNTQKSKRTNKTFYLALNALLDNNGEPETADQSCDRQS